MKQDPYLRYRRWEPLTPLAKVLIGALAVSGCIGLIQAMQIAASMPRTTDITFPITEVGLRLQAAISPAPFSQVGSLVTFGAGIVWLIWQHKAQSDLYARAVPGLQYTPGWAVGWWFVPFANFVMPFLAVRELFAFAGRSSAQGFLPDAQRDWRLGVWWATYVASGFIGTLGLGPLVSALISSIGETPTGSAQIPVVTLTASAIRSAQTWAVIGDLTRVTAAALAIWVVWTISLREDAAAPSTLPMLPWVGASPGSTPPLPPRPDLW